jgi:hypothetical protein
VILQPSLLQSGVSLRDRQAAAAKPTEAPSAPASDTVAIGGHPQLRKMVRFANDAVLQLGLGDAPTAVAVASDLGMLKLSAQTQTALNAINGVNLAMNVVGMALDGKEMHDVFASPTSTKLDKQVEVAHMVLGDAIPTATSILPLVMSNMTANPVINAAFIGTQVLGVAADVAKFAYDVHRGGQQG